jgi:hypothetical protein
MPLALWRRSWSGFLIVHISFNPKPTCMVVVGYRVYQNDLNRLTVPPQTSNSLSKQILPNTWVFA